jgi:hypothetical protein
MKSRSTALAENTFFHNMDARSDLGYGRSSLKFSKPRTKGSAYPYMMTDSEEEESEDIEEIDIDDVPLEFDTEINRFLPVTDFYAAAGTDPFYFAGAATKMSEELGKYVKGTGGIGVTLPAGMGSSTAGFRTIIRPTGTKKGWSQAPAEEEETEPAYRLIDILDDGEATVRHFIRAVLAKERKLGQSRFSFSSF